MKSFTNAVSIVSILVLSLLALTFKVPLCDAKAEDDLSHGLGDGISWVTLEQGLEDAKEHNKLLMLIIHKSWCGACRALKPKLKESKEFEAASESFVMVNVMDDEEPADEKYRPDGGYIPRILFMKPSGEVMEDLINEEGNSKYKYFYSNADSVVTAMNRALKKFNNDDFNNNVKSEL